MDPEVILHGFFRSSASYRVRIALNLKGVAYTQLAYRLRSGEQRHPQYITLNPQGMVPALVVGGDVLTQSLAICEYLEELYPDPPLLPIDVLGRAKVRAAAQVIASDIHPIQNLRVLEELRKHGLTEDAVSEWARHFIAEGLEAFEKLLPSRDFRFCFGSEPSLADVCLIPQLFNAARFGLELRSPRINEVATNCSRLDAFIRADPKNQPDANA